jgi:hypothetical protein
VTDQGVLDLAEGLLHRLLVLHERLLGPSLRGADLVGDLARVEDRDRDPGPELPDAGRPREEIRESAPRLVVSRVVV